MLKEVFKSKGIKQKFLASKMGVSEVTLSNWVTGKTSPSKKNLEKLSDILDVSINEFTQ
ncbi:helix-turn-helix domain-containing protein [Polaribacter tangerinus]|jgi:repressor LexA|uniref:helix-turn-helix domain-containing protein n=1 Tax=Polaribacter tangerinus TaxID=1920034 RepID=UPI000B4BA15A|nr:helix-turn-helix transcriptional regulator [Polaribacter tangerinus]|tara:strand:+ start:437 stop:613 length:177 start_codon:yes stop_codon:yes gene_type:complete